jgi:hypothetical protein
MSTLTSLSIHLKGNTTMTITNTAPTEVPADTVGSRTVQAFELAYTAVRKFHPELPDVFFITGDGRVRGGLNWGHVTIKPVWVQQVPSIAVGIGFPGGEAPIRPKVRYELKLSGQLLDQGARYVLETILHESAHLLALVRGIQDTSRQNRYHNGEFSKLAQEVGLEPPERPDPTIGFSDCRLLGSTAALYHETIAALQEAVDLASIESGIRDKGRGRNGHGGGGDLDISGLLGLLGGGEHGVRIPTSGTKSSGRVKLTCGCGFNLWCAPSTASATTISCSECGGDFV